MYWGEQRRRMAPPPLMSRPGMPVPPLLVSIATAVVFPFGLQYSKSYSAFDWDLVICVTSHFFPPPPPLLFEDLCAST